MSPSRSFRLAGALCLVVGSVGVLAQYLVTPISGDLSVPDLLARATDHHGALGVALALDVPAMLVIPAVLFVGHLAGSRTSVLAGVATALCLVPAIGGVVLFANDAVVYEAAELADRGAAVSLVHGYQTNPMIGTVTAVYLLTHLVGFPMLAVALRRARAVPLWAAVALGVWPILEMLGYAANAKVVAALGYALLALAYVVCARAYLVAADPADLVPEQAPLGQNQPA